MESPKRKSVVDAAGCLLGTRSSRNVRLALQTNTTSLFARDHSPASRTRMISARCLPAREHGLFAVLPTQDLMLAIGLGDITEEVLVGSERSVCRTECQFGTE